jgi:inner membrane protein
LDTITQALLGGAVAYAVAGKTAPRKALLWGAAIAVLPDLDIFIPHNSDLAAMIAHRSWSHSWIIQSLLAPLLALLFFKIDQTFRLKQWWLMTWLALVTHSGLDALTIYGTQLFWPFLPPPVSIGSVFIIDPLYSVPLLIGFILVLALPRKPLSMRLMHGSFVFSCAYLIWGLTAQQWLSHEVKQQLAKQNISTEKMLLTPTPFNSLLWRVLVMENDQYQQGFVSVFDASQQVDLQAYPNHSNLKKTIQDNHNFMLFQWFNNGFYKLDEVNNQVIATDLRMGFEPNYFFSFKLAEWTGSEWQASTPNRAERTPRDLSVLNKIWQRIWNAEVKLNP